MVVLCRRKVPGTLLVLVLATIMLFAVLLGIFNVPSPVLADGTGTQYCTTTGSYSVCTDQTDYSPTSIVHITGFGFAPGSSYTIKVTRPDGSNVTGDGSFVPWWTPYDTVTANAAGNFEFDYVLDGILGQYNIEVLVLGQYDNVLAKHAFTDKKTSTTTNLDQINSGIALTAGSSYSWGGSVDPSGVPANVDVTLRYVGETDTCPAPGGSATVLATTSTKTDRTFGGISTAFTAPAAGKYQFYARFFGDSNYESSDSACQTITVNAAAKSDQIITFSALGGKTYGDADFSISATASSGLTVTFAASGQCSVTGTLVQITGAGSCTITASQSGNSSYNAAPNVPQSFTINKADATIVVTPYSATYDGNAHTATGTATGVKGEDLSSLLDLSGTTHTNAGTYATDAWTFSGSINYNSDSGTASDSIAKADATIDVVGYSGTYDGNAHGATGTATGVKGESLSGLDLGSTFTDVPGDTAHWTFTGATNYNDASGDVSIVINKADAVVSVTPYDVTYDGNSHTATGTATGVLGESLSGLDLSGTTHTAAGTHTGDAWTFTDVTGNYNDASGTVSDKIKKADAVIVVTPYDLTYDGNPQTATGSATGVKGESLSGLDLSGTTHTNAGDYPADAWAFTDVTGNYNDASGTVDDNIDKADALVTVSGYTGVYDAVAHGATGSATGVGGVDLGGSLDLGSSFTNAPGGTAQWTFTGGINYEDERGSVDIVISKATASVTPDAKNKVYGDADPILTGTLTGFMVADGVTATYSRAAGETVMGSPYTIIATLSPAEVLSNYDITHNTADFTITTRPITVTADAKSKTYGDIDPALTYQITSGTLAFSDAFTASLSRDAGENVGTYAIAQGTLALSSNYDLTYVGAYLTITKKSTTIAITAASAQYSDPITLVATVSPATAGGQTLTGSVEFFISGTSVGTHAIDSSGDATVSNIPNSRAAGGYPVTAKFTSTNPNFADGNGGPETLTVTKENTAIAYTGDTLVFTSGTATSASVNLAAHLTQEIDGHPGDLSLAKVTFELTPSSGSPMIVSSVSVGASGDASASRILVADVWTVKVYVDSSNEYWTSPAAESVLTVSLPGLSATGGGWIPDSVSANGKDNFGFTLNYNKNSAPKGSFVFVFRGTDGHDYVVKSNSWNQGGLSFTGTNKAYFTGKATVHIIDRTTGLEADSWGNCRFAVYIADGDMGTPQNQKGSDTIAVTIFDAQGNVWLQLGSTSQVQLGGGNIVVHSK